MRAGTCSCRAPSSGRRRLLTEWKQCLDLDPVEFGRVVARKRVLDGRNALSRTAWEAAGWSYRALGRRGG